MNRNERRGYTYFRRGRRPRPHAGNELWGLGDLHLPRIIYGLVGLAGLYHLVRLIQALTADRDRPVVRGV